MHLHPDDETTSNVESPVAPAAPVATIDADLLPPGNETAAPAETSGPSTRARGRPLFLVLSILRR